MHKIIIISVPTTLFIIYKYLLKTNNTFIKYQLFITKILLMKRKKRLKYYLKYRK